MSHATVSMLSSLRLITYLIDWPTYIHGWTCNAVSAPATTVDKSVHIW